MSCGCRIRAMVSEVPLMYGTVAIVTVVDKQTNQTNDDQSPQQITTRPNEQTANNFTAQPSVRFKTANNITAQLTRDINTVN